MNWIKRFFRTIFRKRLSGYHKDELINVKMNDGSIVPIVNSDKLVLVKNDDGTVEIKIKKD